MALKKLERVAAISGNYIATSSGITTPLRRSRLRRKARRCSSRQSDLRATMPQGMTRPIGVKPEGSKVDRMAAQSAKIEAGHVHLPNSAPWLGDFLMELLSFPNGRHDDQVDSVSQFLRWFQNDAYNQISFVVPPFIFSRPREFPFDGHWPWS